MEDYIISMNKELVNPDLLLQDEPSLPEAMRQLNLCEAFAVMRDNRNIVACLLAKRKNLYEIVNFGIDPFQTGNEAASELLLYVMDFVRVQGGGHVEAGAPNTDLRRHLLFQSLGFRVVGVWPNQYPGNKVIMNSGEELICRDMLRYRADLPRPRR